MSARKSRAPARLFEEPTPQANGVTYTCKAIGCPLRATIFDAVAAPPIHGRCRYHDAASPGIWPRITDLFHSGPFERIAIEPGLKLLGIRWMEDELPPPAKPISTAKAREMLANFKVRAAAGALTGNPLGWAVALRAREDSGENLARCQQQAWRAVLRPAIPAAIAEDDLALMRSRMMALRDDQIPL